MIGRAIPPIAELGRGELVQDRRRARPIGPRAGSRRIGPKVPSRDEAARTCRANAAGGCPQGHFCDVRGGLGRCTTAFWDARTLSAEIESWVGHYVAFRAMLEPASLACTAMACGGEPCCNHCQGSARPIGTNFVHMEGVVCLGKECEVPSCGVIDARGFHVLDGVDVELRGRVVHEHGYFRLVDVVVGVDTDTGTRFLTPARGPW